MADTSSNHHGQAGEIQQDASGPETPQTSPSELPENLGQSESQSKVKELKALINQLGSRLIAGLEQSVAGLPAETSPELANTEQEFRNRVEQLKSSLEEGFITILVEAVDKQNQSEDFDQDVEMAEAEQPDPSNMASGKTNMQPQNGNEWLQSRFLIVDGHSMTTEEYLMTGKFEDGWWTDAHINISLHYLAYLQHKKRFLADMGVTIFRTNEAFQLVAYCEHLRKLDDKTSNFKLASLRKATECEYLAVRLRGTRYGIFPISDGMVEGGARDHTRGDPTRGRHWAFMVVDLYNHTARLIDGELRLKQERRGWVPQGEPRTTLAAATVIVAVNSLLENPGDFTPKLLRFAPNEIDNNLANGGNNIDDWACGPYVMHVLRYLLDHFELVTATPHGLRTSFTPESCGEMNRRIAFNSRDTRDEFQEYLYSVRQEIEEEDASLYPFNLTKPVLREFTNPILVMFEDIVKRRAFTGSPSKSGGGGGGGGGADDGNSDNGGDSNADNSTSGDDEHHQECFPTRPTGLGIGTRPGHVVGTSNRPTQTGGNTTTTPNDRTTGGSSTVNLLPPLPHIDLRDFADETPESRDALQPYIDRLLAAVPELRSEIYADDEDTSFKFTNPSVEGGGGRRIWKAIPYIQQAFEGGWNGVRHLAEKIETEGSETFMVGSKEKRKTAKDVVCEWCKLAFPRGTKEDKREWRYNACWSRVKLLYKNKPPEPEWRASAEIPDLRSQEDQESLPRSQAIYKPQKDTAWKKEKKKD